MISRLTLSCVAFFSLSTISLAQYREFYSNYQMEGQNTGFFGDGVGLEDPSFEFPFNERPRPDKLFVSKDFETNDFSAVQSLTRSWVGTQSEEVVLGRKFLRINGTGCLASWFPLVPLRAFGLPSDGPSGNSMGHYVTVHAKQDGPFEAIFGINYFDANWKLIQKNSALISGAAPGVSRGDGDLLKKYTLPVRVPFDAVYGQVWIAAPYSNGTTTFDFLNVFVEDRGTSNDWFYPHSNLLRNASSRFMTSYSLDGDIYTTGYEFWTATPGSEPGLKVEFWPPQFGIKALTIGQRGRITNLYQVIDVLPNQAYAVRLDAPIRPGLRDASPLPHARAWFGIDFFDSNSNKIDQFVYDIYKGNERVPGYLLALSEEVINPAPNADFAIAWFYVEPLFRDEAVPIYEVDIHIPFPAATASAAKLSTTASATTSKAKTAAKSVKQPATKQPATKQPASPITPAIALQAKNSLPAAPVAPKPKATATKK